ncbi:MAG: MgtE intracellular region [Synergistaceae bacterium]|jgi:flagellar motility protein MotE (MotC chaperone)|nr:MgtE intracellular region [Synergistaceae bacterium]
MAEIDKDTKRTDSAAPDSSGKAQGKKKKKKKRGCGFFMLLAMLAIGASAGLQASGGYDFRPAIYPLVPKIPGVGQNLKEMLNIPERIDFTPEERRRRENEEWETRIADSVRSIDDRVKALDAISKDLSMKEQDLEYEREELASRLEALSNDISSDDDASISGEQQSEISEIVGTFGQMTVRNAAAIVEKLNRNLAVAVLDGLDEDVRANILGRMDVAVAANLTERLTILYRDRKNK